MSPNLSKKSEQLARYEYDGKYLSRRRRERQEAILKFIKESKKKRTTENKIVLNIKALGLGTRDTVRNELDLMKQHQMIKIEKTGLKPTSAHLISINEESELFWIQDMLLKIEILIKETKRPSTRNIYDSRLSSSKMNDMLDKFMVFAYNNHAVTIILDILLDRVNKLPDLSGSIKPQLHAKIFDLTEKLMLQVFSENNPEQVLNSMQKDYLISSELQIIIKSFRKQFLINK